MAKLDPVKMKDWQIAEAAEENLRTAKDLAAELGLLETEWEPYGRYLAKIDVTKVLARLGEQKRAKYIDMGLALGMTERDLNELLTLMGYAPFDENSRTDSELLVSLRKWEKAHPMQRKFKEKYFGGDDLIKLTEKEEHQAVEEMLQLRGEMRDFAEKGE